MKNRFYILLLPSDAVGRQVSALRHTLRAVPGLSFSSSSAPAHLSVCSFLLKAGIEKQLVSLLDGLFGQLNRMLFETKCISSFESSGTLFISLNESEQYTVFQNQLVTELKHSIPALKRNMSVGAVPHLTLARGCKGASLDGVKELVQQGYTVCSFTIGRVSLMLEREGKMSEYKSWNLI